MNVVAYGLSLSVLVSLVVLGIALAIGRRLGGPPGVPWGLAPALGAGYVAGQWMIARPSWPPIDVAERIPYVVLAATALGILEALRPGPAWTRWENRMLFSGGTLLAILGPAVQETWGTRASDLWMLGLGVAIVATWTNLEALAARATGVAILLPLLVVVGGASACLVLSGRLYGGLFCGGLAASLGSSLVVSWWEPRLSLARGGIPVVVLALSALILEGHVYAQLPTASVALLAASPWAIWVARLGPIRRLAPWKAALVGAAAVLVPIGVALGLAFAAAPQGEY